MSAPPDRAVASRSIAPATAATRSGHCASSESGDVGCIPARNHRPIHRPKPKVGAHEAMLPTLAACATRSPPRLTRSVAFTNCASTRWDTKVVPFDRVCREHGITHKLTKPYHPWTNGQAERMNRTVKEATVKAFHYETAEALSAHVLAFVRAYNFAKHLKALRWRTPFQAICDAWAKDPSIFKINPHHLIPGPNT